MEQHRNRQPAGTPTGGQFAQETRGPSGIATLSGPGDGIHAVARDGGYPVVGQALLEANEQGLVSSEQLDALSWEQVTVMGDLDYQGAVADVERQGLELSTSPASAMSEEYLESLCDEAEVPRLVADIIFSAHDRGEITEDEMLRIDAGTVEHAWEDFGQPMVEAMATRVREGRF